MKHNIVLLTVIAFAATLSSAQQVATDAPLPELLEKAIFTEETVGDLDAAMELYEQIVARTDADRTYGAQAQYRLALCLLKKGNSDDAVAALQKLAADFPKQELLVEQARVRLTELGYPGAEAGVTVRRVWAGRDVNLYGSPSPDGGFLTARHRGDLVIHDLATGENRLLTRRRTGWGTHHSVVSPDGRQVAYAWWYGSNLSELRLIGVDGSGQRTLLGGDRRAFRPAAWSLDGDHVVAQWRRHDGSIVIAMVAVADGAVEVLKTLEQGSVLGLSLSPDDRYIVYDTASDAGSSQSDIFVLDVESKQETPLVAHAGADYYPLWTPDGRGVLFLSDRGGSPAAWLVGVADGRSTGQPILVKPDMGSAVPMGFARDGSFYYGLTRPLINVLTAAIDPESGRVTSLPEPALDRFVGRNIAPAWSPDGKRLAYLSQRSGQTFWGSLWTPVVRALDTGEERELALDLRDIDPYQPRWSPDGHRLLVTGSDQQGRQGFYTVDVATGAVAPLVQSGPEEFVEEPAWSPDGGTLFYSREQGSSDQIVAKNLETGEEKVLVRDDRSNGGFPFLSLSPDGRWLAFISIQLNRDRFEIETTGLHVMPATGGEPRELLRRDAPETLTAGLVWTPDGSALIFGTHQGVPHEPERRQTLWRVSVEGGDPTPVGVTLVGLQDLSLHPDGRRLAFDVGRDEAEVWVMENFLPELKGDAVSEVRR
jgi:Tol biopolymer transport system component